MLSQNICILLQKYCDPLINLFFHKKINSFPEKLYALSPKHLCSLTKLLGSPEKRSILL